MADVDLRQTVIDLATATVKDLFERYGITDRDQAKRLVRERFTAEDLKRYQLARDTLDGLGGLG